jgi:hypothetical protein
MKNFTRNLLKEMHQTVRAFMPAIRHPMKAASVTGPSFGQFYVQIHVDGLEPMDVWLKAHDKYEARAAAWDRYLTKHSSGYAEGAAEQEVA